MIRKNRWRFRKMRNSCAPESKNFPHERGNTMRVVIEVTLAKEEA